MRVGTILSRYPCGQPLESRLNKNHGTCEQVLDGLQQNHPDNIHAVEAVLPEQVADPNLCSVEFVLAKTGRIADVQKMGLP